jgi:hypothetical protein
MEALFNYFYYQTLAINGFDNFGHVLRIVAFTAGPCSPYNPDPTDEEIAECKSWLGPYQAGVTTPDPTDNGTAQAEARQRREGVPRAERERHRRAGEPEAPPTPGKPDPSKPQIVLPEGVRDLLERLRDPPKLPRLPELPLENRGRRGVPDGLLEYLLG